MKLDDAQRAAQEQFGRQSRRYGAKHIWIHEVEKWRDPSHGRFLTPGAWRVLCEGNALAVEHCELHPMKQPDLEWYFETAATPEENRRKVHALVANAPEEARRVFRIEEEDGRIVWWWRRLTLIARKAEEASKA